MCRYIFYLYDMVSNKCGRIIRNYRSRLLVVRIGRRCHYDSDSWSVKWFIYYSFWKKKGVVCNGKYSCNSYIGRCFRLSRICKWLNGQKQSKLQWNSTKSKPQSFLVYIFPSNFKRRLGLCINCNNFHCELTFLIKQKKRQDGQLKK